MGKKCAISSDMGFVSNILCFLSIILGVEMGGCKISSQHFSKMPSIPIHQVDQHIPNTNGVNLHWNNTLTTRPLPQCYLPPVNKKISHYTCDMAAILFLKLGQVTIMLAFLAMYLLCKFDDASCNISRF